MDQLIFFVLEIIGTVAFSVSGVIVALKKQMDIFGVVILGMTTAVGGGIIRDLILGKTPPVAFQRPVYALVAIAVALVCFIRPLRKYLRDNGWVMLTIDAVGLGIFTVIGVSSGLEAFPDNSFLAIFVGVLTGVGGGVMRDIFAGTTPSIFVRHFYACASLSGAVLCCIGWQFFPHTVTMLASAAVVVVLRILAAQFRWELPK